MYPMQGAPPMMEHPELSSLKSMLNAARIIALILWILGAIWVLLGIGGAALAASLGLPINFVGIGYSVVFTIVNFLTWRQIPRIEAQVAQGQYRAARDATLIWMILGWFFLFINGLILLLAFLKFDTVLATGGVATGPGANYVPPVGAVPPGGYAAPAGYAPQPGYAAQPGYAPQPGYTPPTGFAAPAPVAAAPAPAPVAAPAPAPVAPPAAAGTTPCPRCGRPLTWIPQYSRWYCYGCSQYA
jgi:hypothetical protein